MSLTAQQQAIGSLDAAASWKSAIGVRLAACRPDATDTGRAVRQLRTKAALIGIMALTSYLGLVFVADGALTAIPLAAVLIIALVALGTCVMHDANHGAFGRPRWLNTTLGFTADCLETIEEIDQENREIYLHAGGERYRYIPALNDRPDHIQAISGLVLRHLQGWIEPASSWSADRAAEAAAATERRAAALRPH